MKKLSKDEMKKVVGGLDDFKHAGDGGCSVTCDTGHFACCCPGDCSCHSELDNITVYDCHAGGHGSSSCSYS